MEDAIINALYDRMAGDAELVAMLSTYDDDGPTGPLPAIFTGPHVPLDAVKAWVWTRGSITNVPDDTKLERGFKSLHDIRCSTDNDADPSKVRAIASRVAALFHRHSLAITGATCVICSVSGPVPAEPEPTELSYIVHVRLSVET